MNLHQSQGPCRAQRRWAWPSWIPLILLAGCTRPQAGSIVTRRYQGVTHIVRTETQPRAVTIHVLLIELAAPGIRFKVSPPAGPKDTLRQTTLGFLEQERAQAAINAHFYLPYATPEPEANLVGLAVSEGRIVSPFEDQPIAAGLLDQSFAILPFAPALNIDATNRATVVHRDPAFPDNRHVSEPVTLWNAVAGSAQIVSNGVKTIPKYSGRPTGLNPGNGYSDAASWYDFARARTAMGITGDGRVLVWFTVDQYGSSLGLRVGEVADLLIRDYGVTEAINLDGGPSTTLALRDPVSGAGRVVNASGDTGFGGGLGSSIALFALPSTNAPGPLRIESRGKKRFVLSWPVPAENWTLVQSPDLAGNAWEPMETTGGFQAVGDRIELELGTDSPARFYRLFH